MAGLLNNNTATSSNGASSLSWNSGGTSNIDPEEQKKQQGLLNSSMTTDDLYKTASSEEAGFVNSAPTGYADPNAPINMPKGAGEGWVKGYLARQELNRQNAQLGMDQETQGWKRTDREKKRMIDDGMVAAAQKGGYNGVIDYLETADPDRAIDFTKAKLGLDQNIMQNDVMKTALPGMKAEALAQGYGVLGKMGAALLNAKPEERSNMYQHMLPMVKAVNPSAPDTLDASATSMFMLAASQATPESILFGNKKDQNQLKGKIGNAIVGKNYLISKGYAPDSPEVKAYDNVLNEGNVSQERLEVQKAKLQLAQQQNSQGRLKVASQALNKINTDYINATNTYQNFKILYDDPARGTESFGSAVTQTARASGEKGALSDSDKKPLQQGAGIIAQAYMEMRKQVGLPGGGTQGQWDNLNNIQKGYYDANSQAYKTKLSAWEESMRGQGLGEDQIQSLLASTKVSGSQQIQQSAPKTEQSINQQYQAAAQQVQQKFGGDKQKLMQLDQIRQQELQNLKLGVGQ